MIPYLKRASEENIPVFLFNMATISPKNDYYVSSIGFDEVEAARKIGEWAVNYFQGEETKIAILEGFPGILNTKRLEGFKEALEGHANMEIVTSQPANWTRAKGQEVTENILTAHPDIDFIWGMYDEMALGALTAIKSKGLLGEIVVAGYDNTLDAYNAIKRGEMMVTVDTCAKEEGRNIIRAIKSYCIDGQEVPMEIFCDSTIYDQNNIDEFNTDNYNYVAQK